MDLRNFKKLFTALVRPHVEYAQSVWSPHWDKDITRIENVQRRATKQIPGLADLSYDDRLRSLHMPTLVYRRMRGDMIECYKMTSDLYDIRTQHILLEKRHVVIDSDRSRGHNKKLYVNKAKKAIGNNNFAHRVTEIWNHLPSDVVNAPSINSFKNQLDTCWENEDILYVFNSTYNKFKNR